MTIMTLEVENLSHINFSSCVNLPAYEWPTNISAKSWLWEAQSNFTIHHSPPLTGSPCNLKGQSHFLVPLLLTSKSFLYRLYLPPLSQPNNTYVCLPGLPFHVFDLNITITKPKSYATFLVHFKRSSWESNTYKNIFTLSIHVCVNRLYLIYRECIITIMWSIFII